MENVIHRLTLDLTGPDVVPRVEVQRDNARTLAVSLVQGGRPYWIGEGVTAVFSARKPDGNPLFNGCAVEKNRVIYHFTDQTTNVVGVVECEILLYSGDERLLASPRFELAVDDLIHQEGDVPESAPEVTALTQMVAAGTAMIEDLRAVLGDLEGVEEILEQAKAAAAAADEKAQAAQHYAQNASDAAVSAEQSATAAGTAAAAAEGAKGQVNSATQQAYKYAYEADLSAQRAEAAAERAENAQGSGGIAEETDPTVPDWAKQPNKPSYTAAEVGAEAAGTVAGSIQAHDTGRYAHNDIRLELQALSDRINAALNSDDVDLDQMAEIVAYIKSNKSLIDAVTTNKVSVSDIVDNLTTNAPKRPLSAAQGVALKNLISQVSASLSGYQPKGDYALNSAIPTKVSQLTNDKDFLARSELEGAVEDALTEAKESGEFDGPRGPAYTLTEADKATITAAVVAALPKYAGEVEAV